MRTLTALAAIGLASAATALAQPAPHKAVPLRPGLTIVTAIAENVGDYESIKKIVSVDAKGYTLSYAADVPEDPDEELGPGEKPTMREVRALRTVLAPDLQAAHEYVQKFGDKQPQVFKGTTALGVSTAVLEELKTKGESALTVLPEGIMGAIGGLLGGLLGGGGDELGMTKMSGTLKLSKEGPKTITVLVNGTPTPLPVVHATVDFDEETSGEFFFHDDPAHPISIRFSLGDSDLQVVRIEFPAEQPATAAPGAGGSKSGGTGAGGGTEAATTTAATMESALKTAGKIDIYGIYFDFASDRIKPESEPVLREIAKVMSDNPAWTLAVGGHTDNVGGTAYNLDLSKRRAASVKQALVARYKVAPARLETNGYGAGSPKAPNTTLEGRAQNRRVELVKR